MKKINDAARFLLDNGLIFEINRKVLHPFGMALEIEINDNGKAVFGKIQDCRDDPEGFLYSEESFAIGKEKLDRFMDEFGFNKLRERMEKLGYMVQESAPVVSNVDRTEAELAEVREMLGEMGEERVIERAGLESLAEGFEKELEDVRKG